MMIFHIFTLLFAGLTAWFGMGQNYKPALWAAGVSGSLAFLTGVLMIMNGEGSLQSLVFRIVPIAIAGFLVRTVGRRLAALANA
jgi:hypothetical protein